MDTDVPDSSPRIERGQTEQVETAEQIELLVESDPALVPNRASALLVEPSVLDQAELEALLLGLGPELLAAMNQELSLICAAEGASNEPHPSATGRDCRHSKLSPFAWLFADHAGAGRSTGHQQGDHLRARRGAGKKARPAPRQTQGSLFGDRR